MLLFIAGRFGINGNKTDLFIHGNVGKNGYNDILKEINDCEKPLIVHSSIKFCYQEFEDLLDYLEKNYRKIDNVRDHYIYIKTDEID